MFTLAETTTTATHNGYHHLRLIDAEGATIAYCALTPGGEAQWDSAAHAAAFALYEFTPRQGNPSGAHWADCALAAALAAADQLLSAALVGGGLTAEGRRNGQWEVLS